MRASALSRRSPARDSGTRRVTLANV
jgi:hypothetical protein